MPRSNLEHTAFAGCPRKPLEGVDVRTKVSIFVREKIRKVLDLITLCVHGISKTHFLPHGPHIMG